MNVRQVLSVVHPFTKVVVETVTGKLIELSKLDPIDLDILNKKQVLKVTPTDYLKIIILIGDLNSAKSR